MAAMASAGRFNGLPVRSVTPQAIKHRICAIAVRAIRTASISKWSSEDRNASDLFTPAPPARPAVVDMALVVVVVVGTMKFCGPHRLFHSWWWQSSKTSSGAKDTFGLWESRQRWLSLKR
eukprot:s1858_g6.t1